MMCRGDMSWRPGDVAVTNAWGFDVEARPKVLVVDDEPAVLRSLARMLKPVFHVVTETHSERSLERLETDGPFAVVLSDLKMPGLDGVELLNHCRFAAPAASRVLLTGNADLESAMGAVNSGRVTAYLTKPIGGEELRCVLDDAVEQHRRSVAERVALHGTIAGASDALLEALRMGNPPAYQAASRTKALTGRYLERHPVRDQWQIEVAATLMHLGHLALGAELSANFAGRQDLSGAEALLARSVPAFTIELVRRIPRLEEVVDIIRHQPKDFESSRVTHGPEGLPFGSRLLRIIGDIVGLEARGIESRRVATELRARAGAYDPDLLERVLPIYAEAVEIAIDLTDERLLDGSDLLGRPSTN